MNRAKSERALPPVLVAQFLSAMADNALLFVAIALIRSQNQPQEWAPLLREFFLLAYIFLAPFAGPFADALPKGRVMLLSNGLKLVGASAMLAGAHPLFSYGIVGVGAAAYSPAKYGILSELVGPEKLVKANSLMEGSTIVAILLGSVAGGVLADMSIPLALWTVSGCYVMAILANLAIPKLPAVHAGAGFQPWLMIADFAKTVRDLARDADVRFSLACTSLFWASGATLQLLLVAWVPIALGITDMSTPANLNGAVAVGIALGARLAAVWITLITVNRALIPGLLLGPMIMALSVTNGLWEAVLLVALIGVCGGMFVVPLNALLQDRGHCTVGSGHAVAVQNFFQNLAMFGMLELYTASIRIELPAVEAGLSFGALLLTGLASIAIARVRPKTRTRP